jgi:hypothetical protein
MTRVRHDDVKYKRNHTFTGKVALTSAGAGG